MSEVQKSSSFSQGKINGLAKLGPTKSCCLWAGPAAQWAYSWASLLSCKFSLPCCDMQLVPETDTEIADTEIAGGSPQLLASFGGGRKHNVMRGHHCCGVGHPATPSMPVTDTTAALTVSRPRCDKSVTQRFTVGTCTTSLAHRSMPIPRLTCCALPMHQRTAQGSTIVQTFSRNHFCSGLKEAQTTQGNP